MANEDLKRGSHDFLPFSHSLKGAYRSYLDASASNAKLDRSQLIIGIMEGSYFNFVYRFKRSKSRLDGWGDL
jgi:hypothetical protein